MRYFTYLLYLLHLAYPLTVRRAHNHIRTHVSLRTTHAAFLYLEVRASSCPQLLSFSLTLYHFICENNCFALGFGFRSAYSTHKRTGISNVPRYPSGGCAVPFRAAVPARVAKLQASSIRDEAGISDRFLTGMWIFTRQQARNETLVDKVRSIAVAKGIDVSVLKYNNQTTCLS